MNSLPLRAALALSALVTVAGCVSAPPLEKVQSTQLCDNGRCNGVTPAVLEQLKQMFADGLSQEFKPCEAKPGDTACTGNDLGLFVLGGPIPGRGALKGMSILSATGGADARAVKLRVAMNETFIGTPIVCSHADATLAVSEQGKVTLEVAPHYCNWALVGSIFTTMSLVFDRIDLGTRQVSGYYAIGVTGVGNGSGNGYAAFKVPDNRLKGQVIAELNSIKKTQVISAADLVALPAPTRPAAEQVRKVALVLGNGSYKRLPLENTRNDANAMAATLRRIGFEVITVIDGDFDHMSGGIREFLAKAQESTVSLVYYAGHGVEVNGRNFLIATDVDMTSPQSVLSHSIDVTEMLSTLGTVTKRTKILILDACRDNPFPEKFKRQQQGLAQIEAPIETFIAFSTSPGKVAEDGEGGNSPYTKTLAVKLAQPGANLEAVFRDVRKTVVSDTNGRQTPWENTSLTTDVKLVSVN